MGLAPHQFTREVSVGDKEEAGRQLVGRSGLDRDGDFPRIAGEADSIAGLQAEPFHVAWVDLQGGDLGLIARIELAFTDAAALLASPARDENKWLWRSHDR